MKIKKIQKEELGSKGLTLIELLVSVTLISILLTVFTSLYIMGLRVYKKEFKNYNLQNENRIILDRIIKEAKTSIGVEQTYLAYNSNTTDTLILKIPSLDQNKDYIYQNNGDFVFDYIIYTKSGNNLSKIVVPNALSVREDYDKVLSDKVYEFNITYSPTLQTASRIGVNLKLKEVFGKEETVVDTASEILFRNKQ